MFKVKTTAAKSFTTGALVYNINFGGTFRVVAQRGEQVTLQSYYTDEIYATPTSSRVLKAFSAKAAARLTTN